MNAFTPWSALIGGALIGVSASMLLALDGRIAGISGILSGILPGIFPNTFSRISIRGSRPATGETRWRITFVAGLLVGGLVLLLVRPSAFAAASTMPSLPQAAIAGVLVGFGTRLGGGCTSGHGVCGISRFSRRSVVATIIFIATGMLATFVVRHLLGARG